MKYRFVTQFGLNVAGDEEDLSPDDPRVLAGVVVPVEERGKKGKVRLKGGARQSAPGDGADDDG